MDTNHGIFLSLTVLILLFGGSLSLLPPPDISNISYTIESDVCSDNRKFLALIIIVSHPHNIHRRNVIRDTYPTKEIAEYGIRRVFALATLGEDRDPYRGYILVDSASEEELEEENESFADILKLNSTEEYRKLTLKSLAALTWAESNCPKAKFIVKTDDDLIMDYIGAAAFLDSIPEEDVDSLNGPLFPNEQPNRDKTHIKHYTSREEYHEKYYPYFLGGSFYATSPKTLKILLETAKTVNFLNSEDVFITGLVAKKAGVKIIDHFDVIGAVYDSLNCCEDDDGDVYACQYFLSLQGSEYSPLTRKQAKRFKRRFQYCTTHRCLNYTTEAAETGDLTCF